MAIMPFPAFLLGFILTGATRFILYLTFAALCGYIGYGLLHLDNRARLATFAFLSFGLVNMVCLLLPWGRAQFLLYNQQIMHTFQFPGAPAPSTPELSYVTFICCGVMVLVLDGLLFWLLQRHRDAFVQTPPAPAS
jgi:hypothetical protein